jgi:hypothetical protein
MTQPESADDGDSTVEIDLSALGRASKKQDAPGTKPSGSNAYTDDTCDRNVKS